MDKMLGGYQALQIRLLNGRIFQKLLSKEPDAQYRSEQGKILTVLWQNEDGRATATDIALASGAYLGFLEGMEDQKVVFLELGVGYNTPTIIRYPFEKMTAVFPKAHLIRLNRDDLEGFAATKEKTISINDDMREVLRQWLAD